ncbi:MAG: aminotransferase class IV, partial [Anaerolineae bacterium]|nr:aminotransferase class IV [Anaerolineae bacterium]
MSQLPVYVCRNGDLIPADQARVSIFNPALYTAFGVYESIQCENEVIFHLDDHLERLARSARLLDMPLPADLGTMAAWMPPLLRANHTSTCLIRLYVLGPNGHEPALAFAWPEAPRVYSRSLYEVGASAIVFHGARALPQAKSLNTLVNFLARRQAQAAGAHEGLLAHGGYVYEGSSSNLFAVRDGCILTPPEETVLSGLTREIVLRLAREEGIPVSSELLPEDEIHSWDEAFITSTSRHVMPLVRVDGQPIGSGRVGSITRRLMEAFEAYYRSYVAVSNQAW